MIVECQNLHKTYVADDRTLTAVNNVNLEVNSEDFVVILGHSGSGKTTLLSLIGGLTKPDNGKVLINGVENWQQSDDALATMRNSNIGFIFQFSSLIPTLTVLENVLLPLSFGARPEGDRKFAVELLETVGLADKHNAFPAQLSGGQQRRVAIARAFINRPEIILADEPTGDLDEDTENEILAIFRKYNQEKGVTFLAVTHNSHFAASQHRPRVFHMKNGSLKEAHS